MSRIMRAVGLMSGTSIDGVDVALIETDGETVHRFGPTGFRPYSESERACLRQALQDAVGLKNRADRPGCLGEAEALVTAFHAEAVESFFAQYQINPASIDVIGFHGQTVLHRPDLRLTVQLGDGAELARKTGCRVVYDFRAADMEAGGEGAPLVPVFHQALVKARPDLPRPLAVLNVGGVANITYIGASGELIACDTGPGNALIDDMMRERLDKLMDRDGECAAQGSVNESVLKSLLDHPFFRKKWPKSLDRNTFSTAAFGDMPTVDAVATLTAFTAAAAAHIIPHLPAPPVLWIVCGGGAHNRTLVKQLRYSVKSQVMCASQLKWSEDALEAQAFGFLAVSRLCDLPMTYSTTTGCFTPTVGGIILGASNTYSKK